MIFAPVLIPTLNRYEHLERCIRSLQENGWADKTELYISVDFSDNSKYAEGRKKVLSLLQNDIKNIKKVHIYYQDENLGPARNIDFLVEQAEKEHKAYILSEDDNEFSRNFLEYMDKCLSEYENDESIIGICAIQEYGKWSNNQEDTIVRQQICPAYGYGSWTKKECTYRNISSDYFRVSIAKDRNAMSKIRRKSRLCYQQFVEGILYSGSSIFEDKNGRIRWSDTVRSIYAIANDKYVIAPVISKAKNWGFDGSGQNMQKSEKDGNLTDKWPIDTAESFSVKLMNDPEQEIKNNEILNRNRLQIGTLSVIKCDVKYLIFMLSGSDYIRTRRLQSTINSFLKLINKHRSNLN